MHGTCKCYSCTAINVFGTIYALFRCYTAVSRRVVQLISMKAYATVPKGITDSGLYVYIIDQARGQDGWILAEFSFCVFMDRDELEVHKNVKRERGQYPAILTELAWSIKDLLYGIKSTEKNDLRTCLFSSTEKEPS